MTIFNRIELLTYLTCHLPPPLKIELFYLFHISPKPLEGTVPLTLPWLRTWEISTRKLERAPGKRPLRPSELVRKLKRHLNIAQVSINGIVYILEDKYPNIHNLATSQNYTVELNEQETVNNQIKNSIGHLFNDALAFADKKKTEI